MVCAKANSTLARVVEQHSSISYFNKILGSEATTKLNSTANLTLFLPVDHAWDTLDPYERLYLESEFAADDLKKILDMHAVVQESVKWSDTFQSGLNCESTSFCSFSHLNPFSLSDHT